MRSQFCIIVILVLALCSLVEPESLVAQDREGVPFNGLIKDVSGSPIRGARIFITPNLVARSDKKGRFGLTDVAPTDTLHIRYRKTRYDIPVDGRKSISIRLGDQLETHEDEELVNWGYGYVKKRESLEVSSGISGEELIRTGYTSLAQALQGRIPGLTVINSGRVGEQPSLNIRGINSLYADQTPLFVVDGVVTNSIDYISVYDVEHVEVLKDASIYGARGANGAILITLKKGL